MKVIIACLFSFSAFCQVQMIELLPDHLYGEPTNENNNPSFNDTQKRLCYLRTTRGRKSESILVSEKKADGTWGDPYVAFESKKASNAIRGLRLNSAGDKIYFGWNNDLYFMDYLSNNTWSKPLLIKAPVSGENMEIDPAVSADGQTLFFLRNVRNDKPQDSEGGWKFVPYYSKKDASQEWTMPRPIRLEGFKDILWRFSVDNKQQLAFFLTSSTQNSFNNYVADFRDSVCTNIRKLDFHGGVIQWLSSDLTSGLIATNTTPQKIGIIRFAEPLSRPRELPVMVAAREALPEVNTTTVVKPMGKYYALLIGVSRYDESSLSLEQPAKDIAKLKDTLSRHYEFEPADIRTLTNPTRQEIMSELYRLRNTITVNDNLLIFYAGHGYFDKSINQGYWWPRDASAKDPSFWLSNSDLREQIRGINSAHTLLISDACFSGAILRERSVDEIRKAPMEIKVLYKTKSRRVITSGNMSTVPDQSVFFNYLLKRLSDNEESFIPAQALFNSLKLAVINNSLNIPMEGVIADSGDEGGDFIFIKKK